MRIRNALGAGFDAAPYTAWRFGPRNQAAKCGTYRIINLSNPCVPSRGIGPCVLGGQNLAARQDAFASSVSIRVAGCEQICARLISLWGSATSRCGIAVAGTFLWVHYWSPLRELQTGPKAPSQVSLAAARLLRVLSDSYSSFASRVLTSRLSASSATC